MPLFYGLYIHDTALICSCVVLFTGSCIHDTALLFAGLYKILHWSVHVVLFTGWLWYMILYCCWFIHDTALICSCVVLYWFMYTRCCTVICWFLNETALSWSCVVLFYWLMYTWYCTVICWFIHATALIGSCVVLFTGSCKHDNALLFAGVYMILYWSVHVWCCWLVHAYMILHCYLLVYTWKTKKQCTIPTCPNLVIRLIVAGCARLLLVLNYVTYVHCLFVFHVKSDI